MTNTQLYLAIGLPILMSALFNGLLVVYINTRFNAVDARFDAIDTRLNDLRDLWRAELRRVEEVIDARLKHLEER